MSIDLSVPNAIDASLQKVADQDNNSSALSISNEAVSVSLPDDVTGIPVLHILRGKLGFSNTPPDPNHAIYNNLLDLDEEGAWDGMKMNVYDGLQVRLGNANGAVPAPGLSVVPTDYATAALASHAGTVLANQITANRFTGTIQIAQIDTPASAATAGTLRYREVENGSVLEMCMKNGPDQYLWVVIRNEP